MKKLFTLLAIAGSLYACSDGSKTNSAASGDTAAATTTTTPVADAGTKGSTAAKDSVMQFKNGKVQISVGGTWSDLSATITTANGRTVTPGGDVSKNGKTRKLEEGMMIDKDGQLMDKDGKPLDTTGWE